MKKIVFILFIAFLFFANIVFAQHLKKDGTPDMRYKENKVNYSPSSSTSNYYTPTTNTYDNSSTHLKKDGTPDMRYKENKESYSPPPSSSSSNYTIPPSSNYVSPSTNIYNSNSASHIKNDGTPDMRFK